MFFICGLFVFLIWRVLVPNHFMENSVPEQSITVQSDVFNYYLPKVIVQNLRNFSGNFCGYIFENPFFREYKSSINQIFRKFGSQIFEASEFSRSLQFSKGQSIFEYSTSLFSVGWFSGKRLWTVKSVSSFGCFNPSWNIFRKCSSWSCWRMACYDSSRLVFSFALTFSSFLIGWDLKTFLVGDDRLDDRIKWNCVVDASGGSANTASKLSPDLSRKEFRGLLAIGITVNFVNQKTQAEANVEEISGVASIYKQHFFAQLRKGPSNYYVIIEFRHYVMLT